MIFRRDVSSPEGPIAMPDGSWVITEIGRGIISHVSADGKEKRTIARTGRPNGLALDAAGDLWVAESRVPALLKVTIDGDVVTISTGRAELPFLWPNDLCFGPDGAIYMTDSGIINAEWETIELTEVAYMTPVDGRVFRIDPATGNCSLLDRGLRFANGIAFGPGGTHLYVAETLTGNIYRYRIIGGEVRGGRELFANVMIKPCIEYGRVAGPDGMAFDIEGSLYVAVLLQRDVTILDPQGGVKERIQTDGVFPTNVAFAAQNIKRILVTEGAKNQLEMYDTPASGLPLYSQTRYEF